MIVKEAAVLAKGSFTREGISPRFIEANDVLYSSNLTISTDPSIVLRELKMGSDVRIKAVHDSKTKERHMGDDFVLDKDKEMDNGLPDEEVVGASSKSAVEDPDSTMENPRQHKHGLPPHKPAIASNVSLISKQAAGMLESHEEFGLLQSGSATSSNSSPISTFPVVKRKKRRTTISEMNNILLQNRASYLVEPQWSSSSDRELLSLKRQIDNAPIVRDDPELYAPWNLIPRMGRLLQAAGNDPENHYIQESN
ncbi:hypothetical protein ACLOJK_027028 [Asimina triloba]